MEYYDWNTVEYYGISTIDMKYMNTIEYSNNIYIIYIIIMYYILNYIILFIYTRHFPLKRACRAVIPVALVTLTEVTIHLKDQIC